MKLWEMKVYHKGFLYIERGQKEAGGINHTISYSILYEHDETCIKIF